MKAQTDHIQICRNAWIKHEQQCPICGVAYCTTILDTCEQGRVLYGEYAAAIEANRDLEQCEGKSCDSKHSTD